MSLTFAQAIPLFSKAVRAVSIELARTPSAALILAAPWASPCSGVHLLCWSRCSVRWLLLLLQPHSGVHCSSSKCSLIVQDAESRVPAEILFR